MKTFKELFEAKDTGGHGSEKHHALAFGRMNPITTGHEAVVNKLHSVAKEHGASHSLVVSHSQDAKKNPLSAEQKVKHAKRAFPGTNVSAASKEHPTILHHAAEAHKAGAQHLHVVAGSDRHEEMHKLLHKYNGQHSAHGHYNFKSITVHSSGERDPDSEGTTGISASKMREHAASGNKTEFHKGAPSKMSDKHKEEMYHDVRKGMNIKEETTPYWKKASWNKKMSALAKQERLAREKKEAEQKPVKEDVEQLDELNAGTIKSYIKKNISSGRSDTEKGETGLWRASSKHAKTLSTSTLNNKVKKLGNTSAADHKNPYEYEASRSELKNRGTHHFAGRVTKEEVKEDVEQLDELSKDTLKSYITKSTKDMAERKRQENIELNRSKQDRLQGKYGQRSALAKAERHSDKAKSRAQNIGKAAMKYATEETVDQQDDRAKQLKRFQDQLAALISGNRAGGLMHEPTEDMHPRHNKIKHMTEEDSYLKQLIGKLRKGMKLDKNQSELVKGHIGRSKKYTKHKNEINIDESRDYEEAEEHLSKANDAEAKGDKKSFHAHMANHHDSMSMWHDSKGRSASADKHAEKAEYHHEKSLTEGTIQQDGTDRIETSTSAPTASTSKDTTMGKKVKGFKFFKGENQPAAAVVREGKAVNVDKVNAAGQEPHEEKFETVAQKAMNIAAKKKQVKEEAEVEQQLQEVLAKDTSAGDWIHDFIHSDNPKFAGKSKEKRKQMALAAYYAKQRNEETCAPVAPVPDRKYIKGTPEWKAHKEKQKPRTGHPTNEEVEIVYEANIQPTSAKSRSHISNLSNPTVNSVTHKSKQIGLITKQSDGSFHAHHSAAKLAHAKSGTFDSKDKAHQFIRNAHADAIKKGTLSDKFKKTNEEVEVLDEKSQQARRNKTYKNLMAASRGARVNRDVGLTPADTGHKNNQQMNKAIGRAVARGEMHEGAATGNPGGGYHGAQPTADDMYKDMHAHVKTLTDGDDKAVKNYLDSAHGSKLAGREKDHDYIKSDFDKFMKYYRPKVYDTKEPETQVKKEETMKSYKEFLQTLDEKLIGKQKKLDKNHNGKLDSQDFAMLRKEETLDEIKMADLPSRKIQGKSYGANYEDPEGAFETKDDMKKPEKKAAGRKSGQRTGSYKPRATMSKLKQAGATYK